MEPSKRSELTDILCVEVTQKLEVLEQTLTVQGIMSNGHLHTPQGPPLTTEQYALLAEHVWGEKAHKGLADARAAIQEAEEYEHQRSVYTFRVPLPPSTSTVTAVKPFSWMRRLVIWARSR